MSCGLKAIEIWLSSIKVSIVKEFVVVVGLTYTFLLPYQVGKKDQSSVK